MNYGKEFLLQMVISLIFILVILSVYAVLKYF